MKNSYNGILSNILSNANTIHDVQSKSKEDGHH